MTVTNKDSSAQYERLSVLTEGSYYIEEFKFDQHETLSIGYLRLFRFESAHNLIASVAKTLKDRARNWSGLIIDLRANSGGDIPTACQLLELISAGKIEHVRFQFRNTWQNFYYCSKKYKLTNERTYQKWAKSIESRIDGDHLYSDDYPFPFKSIQHEDPDKLLKLLLVDGSTASAAEVFAAGFIDNEMGFTIGTEKSTAGAGAHIQSSRTLDDIFDSSIYPFQEAFQGGAVWFSLARMVRAGKNAGKLIEGVGIELKCVIPVTYEDVMYHNRNLLNEAISLIKRENPTP